MERILVALISITIGLGTVGFIFYAVANIISDHIQNVGGF